MYESKTRGRMRDKWEDDVAAESMDGETVSWAVRLQTRIDGWGMTRVA